MMTVVVPIKQKNAANALRNSKVGQRTVGKTVGGYNVALRVARVTFARSKIDSAPRKRSKIICLNEHTSMTVRDIATVAGLGKSSISRILRTFQDLGSSIP
ncbi:hypothetical protein TNCV_3381751 [Trichonephila clavipes]|nr:hypothetical protein TNCV_3381751 [Trichonephila clavipes]